MSKGWGPASGVYSRPAAGVILICDLGREVEDLLKVVVEENLSDRGGTGSL